MLFKKGNLLHCDNLSGGGGTSAIKGFAKLYDYVLNNRLGTSHSGSRQEANLKDVLNILWNLSHKEGPNCTSLL